MSILRRAKRFIPRRSRHSRKSTISRLRCGNSKKRWRPTIPKRSSINTPTCKPHSSTLTDLPMPLVPNRFYWVGFPDGNVVARNADASAAKEPLGMADCCFPRPTFCCLMTDNHLDVDAVEWLEEFLQGYDKTYVVITMTAFLSTVLQIASSRSTAVPPFLQGQLFSVSNRTRIAS